MRPNRKTIQGSDKITKLKDLKPQIGITNKSGEVLKTDIGNDARYFMSIDEAVLLILQSTVIGTSNLLVLEMGEQIKILDIAEILINLNKIENPDKNIQINFIGLRNLMEI